MGEKVGSSEVLRKRYGLLGLDLLDVMPHILDWGWKFEGDVVGP